MKKGIIIFLVFINLTLCGCNKSEASSVSEPRGINSATTDSPAESHDENLYSSKISKDLPDKLGSEEETAVRSEIEALLDELEGIGEE